MNNIYCLKTTQEEIKQIPINIIKKQKKKILLITQGKKGSILFALGKKFIIKPKKIVNCKNTIGAGDTFFAYFISKYIKTKKILVSAQFASNKTCQFLAKKNDHHSQLF